MTGASGTLTLATAGDHSHQTFVARPDATSGTDIVVVACFVAGTRISTEHGNVAVETLEIGERVHVAGPSAATLPIVWLGHRRIDCTRHPDPTKIWPVRIARNACGAGRPHRDLWLSPDHALHIRDVLIPVKYLINGTSIAQVPCDAVTYYHVELIRHSVLLAEGMPSESYLNTGSRSSFINGGSSIELHPDFASRQWEAEACAPLLVTGPELDDVRRWINMLASATGQQATEDRFHGNAHCRNRTAYLSAVNVRAGDRTARRLHLQPVPRSRR